MELELAIHSWGSLALLSHGLPLPADQLGRSVTRRLSTWVPAFVENITTLQNREHGGRPGATGEAGGGGAADDLPAEALLRRGAPHGGHKSPGTGRRRQGVPALEYSARNLLPGRPTGGPGPADSRRRGGGAQGRDGASGGGPGGRKARRHQVGSHPHRPLRRGDRHRCVSPV